MPSVLRAASFRIGVAGLLLSLSLSGCDAIGDMFGKSKVPLQGERVPVFAERGELEPDKDMANVEIVLPAPGRSRAVTPTTRCTISRSAIRRR
jgi:hypothetical protein